MKCWHCGSNLIWGGDHDIEDVMEKGIVTNLSCSNEKCNTHVEVYHYLDSDNEEDIKEAILKEIDWGGGRGVIRGVVRDEMGDLTNRINKLEKKLNDFLKKNKIND
tara:strand:+ start:1204 stop:1521 length:318 start_codon:yes stop_codon:yes gene_type:complete